ncbi:nuclear transport factor 2 family protein [Microbacterium sp. NPDC056057]|uniref:nuclear transport factor 2 family protein n=1 Tax=Microbacterium sp. NPDC056057 TaxID=3345699 RepID=UPI0035E2F76A
MDTVLQRLTQAQNDHDAERFASFFALDYRSEQPAHPGREFVGRAQVFSNWTGVFAGIPDFHAELLSFCRLDDMEWGELAWSGHHTDGQPYAACGVIVAIIRDGLIASARLYVESIDPDEVGIDAVVERVFRPPHP